MKTAGKENQNFCAAAPSNRVHGAAGQEQILLNDVGCESRKIPAAGEVFFLDFPFYRTYHDLVSGGDDLGAKTCLLNRLHHGTSPSFEGLPCYEVV